MSTLLFCGAIRLIFTFNVSFVAFLPLAMIFPWLLTMTQPTGISSTFMADSACVPYNRNGRMSLQSGFH